MNKFELSIIEGLRATIKDYILLKGLDFENQWTKPEYLATVNIAKSISKFNSYPAEKIIIAIEESTEDFSNKCVPEISKDIFNLSFNDFNTERNGKIDIAVYKNDGKTALCAIEVKNFNPTKTAKDKVILDLKRNAQYFLFENENSQSIIKKTYLAYFRHFPETRFQNQIQNDLNSAKKELEEIIKTEINPKGFNFRVEVATVHDNLLYLGKHSDEEIFNDTGDLYAQAVHFVGVIGVFEK